MASSVDSNIEIPKKKEFRRRSVRETDENIFVIHNLRNKVHPAAEDEIVSVPIDHDNPVRQHPSTQNNNDVTARTESIFEPPKIRKSFLRIFVRYAPYLLLRPLREEDAIKNKYAIHLQRILFVAFNVLAFLNTLGNIKQHLLEKSQMNVLRFYAVLLYFSNNFFLRLCCIYITCKKWKGLHSLSHQKESEEETEQKSKMVKYSTLVVVALLIVSAGVACANPIVEAGEAGKWNGKGMTEYHASILFAKIFKWDTGRKWKEQFFSHVASRWEAFVALAIGNVLMETIGDLQLHLMLDLTLTAAMTMHSETQILRVKIKRSKPSDYKDDSKTKAVLLPYYDLRSFHETLDETFNFTLQFLILDNLLFCVYMACNHGLSETSAVLVILDSLILIKVGWFIISSVRAASVNDVFRKWVRTSFPPDGVHVSDEKPKVTMAGLLDEIANDPIGFGSSIFFMNRGFIYGFLRSVTSGALFLFNLDD